MQNKLLRILKVMWYSIGKEQLDEFENWWWMKKIELVTSSPGPCLITAIWRCRKPFSRWQHSFQRKLRSHWLKFLWQHHVTIVRQGPGEGWLDSSPKYHQAPVIYITNCVWAHDLSLVKIIFVVNLILRIPSAQLSYRVYGWVSARKT